MAKKFGEIVSDLEGVDGQLLRVKEDGTGFEFVDPASIPDYTITNTTTDRVLNADETTIDELADVLGTLIADLEAAGLTGGSAGLEAFQWSTSEQVWPFEKAADGSTLYCKEIDFGAIPNNGEKNVAHNISGLTTSKVFSYQFYWISTSYIIHGPWPFGSKYLYHSIDPTYVRVVNNDNLSHYNGKFRIIYTKTT